jgi:hypothetical protein
MMMRIRIILPATALWVASSSCCSARAMAVRKCLKCFKLFRVFRERALFVRGVMRPYFQWARRGRGEALVSCLGELAKISWYILPLVMMALRHYHRAGFEPHCASPFKKWVNVPRILGEAARA